MNKKVFNPARLKFAREKRGFTIRKLCDCLKLTTKSLSDYENGRRDPNDKTISEIAKILNFQTGFFFLGPLHSIEPSSVSFRSLARMRASVRNSALRAGELALEMDTWINRRFELPKADLPDLYNYSSVAAAEAIRNAWGLGEKPIRNMVSTLEAKGIRVYSLAEDTQDMDAYSFWASDQPFIFLNTKKTVERSRFDAAHELGHLILHKHGEPMGKEIEAQANSFASALLMPEGSVKSHAIHYPSLKDIITLKSFWLVSASSLVRRLKDLNLITEWQYRSLTIDLSRNGYMKNEPEPICTREESKLLPMVFSALKEEGISKGDVAKELGIPIEDINALTFKTQLTSIPGKNSKPASINSKNDYLKVIK